MKSIVSDLKNRFKNDGVLIKLIFINIAIFLLFHLVGIFSKLFGFDFSLVEYFVLPAKWNFIYEPWTLITHMFSHVGVSHIFLNLLLLFFMGRMFENYFGQKRLWLVYVLGGLAGAVLLILITSFSPYFADDDSVALGASAAVMAIAIAVCAYAPLAVVHLFGIVPLQLRYLGLILFIGDIINFYDGNSGGHVAHIGGALFGFYFARKYNQKVDITKGFSRFVDRIVSFFKRSDSNLYVSHSKARKMTDEDYNFTKKKIQERVDEILDKIGRSGYESLTKEEKDFLNKSSRQ